MRDSLVKTFVRPVFALFLLGSLGAYSEDCQVPTPEQPESEALPCEICCEGLSEEACMNSVGCAAHYDMYCYYYCENTDPSCCTLRFIECVSLSETCAPQPALDVSREEAFSLRLGQTAFVEPLLGEPKPSPLASISFVRLSEDSRCPLNALCFWPGLVTVEIEVALHDGSVERHSMTLIEGAEEQAYVIVGDSMVSLLAVTPYPSSLSETDPCLYSVELLVSELAWCGLP